MHPNPEREKDLISHDRFWARSGFKDPCSHEERIEFSKCDVQCANSEHEPSSTKPANPSYCTLAMFHAPKPQESHHPTGHVSPGGHYFECQHPSE
ncbi:hypothetical protein RSOLAG22IIIB_10969 [Rhizoctonia solani]|uniref:Uncharacterized protein n=1 Tax=Rhizoctonia solani TaxID=456999 RepID=A0A0K6G6V9_9AGAM|nr:hypothetical protein RSOLAG22IIIB_10969 [Rhizoctonia solani]